MTGRIPDEAIAAVKAIPTKDVAAWLDLEPARERRKYRCVFPGCDSSDGLHAYPDGFKCYSCGAGGSVVDLVMARQGVPFADAVRALAGRFGVLLPAGPAYVGGAAQAPRRGARGGRPAPTPPRPPIGAQRAAQAAARPPAEPPAAIADREAVYAALLELTTLGAPGRAYLAARGFRGLEALADADGFRSIGGRGEWDALARQLARRFPTAQIQDAVTPLRADAADGERHALPFGGRAPVLVLPYRYRGRVVGIRFRNLTAGVEKRDRYRDLGGRKPPMPFNADALDGCAGAELHVVEGELNAWTLAGEGLRAIGLPGAATPWRSEWTPLVTGARRLVAWYDRDKAGTKGAEALAGALQSALGSTWLAAHGRAVLTSADANDLLKTGTLHALLSAAPWRDAASGSDDAHG